MKLIFTDGNDSRFVDLCSKLDQFLNKSVGGEKQQAQYDKYNTLESIKDVVLVLYDDKPVACGSFKEYEEDCVELKRIFVCEDFRREGLGRKVVNELEKRAREKGYNRLILETGRVLVSAQNMYSKLGFKVIDNY